MRKHYKKIHYREKIAVFNMWTLKIQYRKNFMKDLE